MRFFRRRPKNDPETLLRELRDIAKDLAGQMYEHSLVNPPRTRQQIDEAARAIFEDIAANVLQQSKTKDIGLATAAMIYNDMFDTFSERYTQLTEAHNNG